MEGWSFPPAYDDGYLPPADSPYWFPVRETMDPGERERAVVVRLREVMGYAWEHSGFYRRKWEEAGIHPEQVTSLEAFERVPVVTKAELRAAQAADPPFGDYLCVPRAEVAHIHGTSGTTGQPTAFGVGRADWQTIANNHARILWGMGLRPGDTVFVAAIFSLYLGSWGAMLGAERLRCTVFPFGAGAPGMTARAAQWLAATRPRALYGTPSYALRLAEVAIEEGIDPHDFGL
jgi:phenylacetate-CoA ligase